LLVILTFVTDVDVWLLKNGSTNSHLGFLFISGTCIFSSRYLLSFVIFCYSFVLADLLISSTLPLTKHFLPYFADKLDCVPGIFSTIHTFGADLKLNQHIHCLITAGGISLDETKRISVTDDNKYIDYKYMNKVYKAILVKHMREFIRAKLAPEERSISHTKTAIYTISHDLYKASTTKKDKDVFVKLCDWVRNATGTVGYTVRYAKRLPISQANIKKHSYDNKVSFQYYDKKDKLHKILTLPALEFIGRLVVHIPDKHFKTTRYSWIFAPNKKKKYLELIKQFCPIPDPLYEKYKTTLENFKKKIFSYTAKLEAYFWRDPRLCKACGSHMRIIAITLHLKHKTVTIARSTSSIPP